MQKILAIKSVAENLLGYIDKASHAMNSSLWCESLAE